MRNVFDQYSQPENRLTHALAVCLDEDRELLRGFLEWIAVKATVRASELEVLEQTLPGDPPEVEELAEPRGLPDIVIHDGAAWCLLIESKIEARLQPEQLQRHEKTLRRRGFEQVHCLALTKQDASPSKRAEVRKWSELYEWLGMRSRRGEWSERLRSYLRAAEVRLVREAYLTEGTLTMFDGFHFSPKAPYTYGEGKRLLKLALAELRKNEALLALGVDPKAPGRSAITGKGGNAVWDFLLLRDRPKRGTFTGYPHLTLSVVADNLEVAITIPNGVNPAIRKRLAELGPNGIAALNETILGRAKSILARGAWLEAYAQQRHYLSQRSPPITDAKLTFNLQTSQPGGTGPVRPQLEWVQLFANLFHSKRSNIQLGYVMHIPWATKGLSTRESLWLISHSWCAMKPLLDFIRGANKGA
jgi:hypothetical protein